MKSSQALSIGIFVTVSLARAPDARAGVETPLDRRPGREVVVTRVIEQAVRRVAEDPAADRSLDGVKLRTPDPKNALLRLLALMEHDVVTR